MDSSLEDDDFIQHKRKPWKVFWKKRVSSDLFMFEEMIENVSGNS